MPTPKAFLEDLTHGLTDSFVEYYDENKANMALFDIVMVLRYLADHSRELKLFRKEDNFLSVLQNLQNDFLARLKEATPKDISWFLQAMGELKWSLSNDDYHRLLDHFLDNIEAVTTKYIAYVLNVKFKNITGAEEKLQRLFEHFFSQLDTASAEDCSFLLKAADEKNLAITNQQNTYLIRRLIQLLNDGAQKEVLRCLPFMMQHWQKVGLAAGGKKLLENKIFPTASAEELPKLRELLVQIKAVPAVQVKTTASEAHQATIEEVSSTSQEQQICLSVLTPKSIIVPSVLTSPDSCKSGQEQFCTPYSANVPDEAFVTPRLENFPTHDDGSSTHSFPVGEDEPVINSHSVSVDSSPQEMNLPNKTSPVLSLQTAAATFAFWDMWVGRDLFANLNKDIRCRSISVDFSQFLSQRNPSLGSLK